MAVAVPLAATVAGSAHPLATAATDPVPPAATGGSATVAASTTAAGTATGAAGSATASPAATLRKGRTDGEHGDHRRDHDCVECAHVSAPPRR
jgi:hypothetical protein